MSREGCPRCRRRCGAPCWLAWETQSATTLTRWSSAEARRACHEHWLSRVGIDHLVLERQTRLGGSWHDRWDSFHLVAPNYTLLLPGMPYAGPEPDAFMARDDVIEYVKAYAAFCRAPLRLGTAVTRLTRRTDRFEARADGATFVAENVGLATGPYQRPKLPPAALTLAPHIQQLHSQDYRRPGQLAAGGVLVVGTGQSGAQIAEELHEAGRDVHVSVSMCPSVPRRYRGRDVIWWLMQAFLHGDEVGVHFPTVTNLPRPPRASAATHTSPARAADTTSACAGSRARACTSTVGSSPSIDLDPLL